MGLIAGWGRYPIVVAEAIRRQGRQVFCLAIRGHADPQLRALCDDYRDVGLARLGAMIRYFRRRGVRLATMAGKVHKRLIFSRFFLLRHTPDWQCIRTFAPHFLTMTKDRKDDTLLLATVEAFARYGITFAPATDFLPELLVRYGQLAGRTLTARQWMDIQFGWELAREMGRLDVGQSVAVKGRAVLAVEAVEGTDECIRRAGALCPAGGFTVVKVAKPQQDMRFDVPTIGLNTIEVLSAAGGSVLAVEAHRTILLDEEAVIAEANRRRITLVAVDEAHLRALNADAA